MSNMSKTYKSRRFTQCNTSSNRPNGTIAVLDPTGCKGLLHITVPLTLPTRGRDEWLAGKLQKDLSLCTLFQKGRCHAHTNCFQVHADTDFIASLRATQASMVSCCQSCGDSGSRTTEGAAFLGFHIPPSTQLRVTFPNGEARVVDQQLLAFTEGLSQQFRVHGARVENGFLEIPIRRVCRLHLKSFCKYGKDCKNVHLCCKLGEAFLEEPAKKETAAPIVSHLPPSVESVEVPPIPCFRVPSLSVLRAPTAAQEPEERSQDEDRPIAKLPSFKFSHSTPFGESSDFGSRLRKPFVFDAEIALEDSKFDQSVFDNSEDSFNSNSSSGISNESVAKPAMIITQSRRSSLTSQDVSSPQSHHTIHLNPLHPCSKASLVSSPACRLNPSDIQKFVARFA